MSGDKGDEFRAANRPRATADEDDTEGHVLSRNAPEGEGLLRGAAGGEDDTEGHLLRNAPEGEGNAPRGASTRGE